MAITKRSASSKPIPALDSPHLDAKTEFFLTASHQLKSPVAIIQWCLQSLLEEASKFEPGQRKLIQKSLEQANGMSALIQDMLQVFRVMHPKEELVFESVNLNDIVIQLLDEYDPIAQKKGVHLVRGPLEKLPIVLGKSVMLRQALLNLIDNAIKYTPQGKKVIVSTSLSQGWIQIVIKDEGIGIPSTEQIKLFTEFFRGEEAKEVASGTGLGLILVKHIAEQHNGKVDCDSEFHKGTTFSLRLPVQSQKHV